MLNWAIWTHWVERSSCGMKTGQKNMRIVWIIRLTLSTFCFWLFNGTKSYMFHSILTLTYWIILSRSTLEQRNLVESDQNRHIIHQSKEDKHSLFALEDDDFCKTGTSSLKENSKIKTYHTKFKFDGDTCILRFYQTAIRSNIWQALLREENINMWRPRIESLADSDTSSVNHVQAVDNDQVLYEVRGISSNSRCWVKDCPTPPQTSSNSWNRMIKIYRQLGQKLYTLGHSTMDSLILAQSSPISRS